MGGVRNGHVFQKDHYNSYLTNNKQLLSKAETQALLRQLSQNLLLYDSALRQHNKLRIKREFDILVSKLKVWS